MDNGDSEVRQYTEAEVLEKIREMQGHGMSKRRKCKHRDTKKKVTVKARKNKRKQQRKARRK